MSLRILVLALCMACLAAPAAAQPSAEYRLRTVLRGLAHPWALVFLPDGRALLTERSGRLRLVVHGRLLAEPVAGLPRDIYVEGEAGLLDVAIDPGFARNGVVYLTLTRGDRDANATCVLRGRLVGTRLEDVRTLFESRPRKRGAVHNGGRMVVLADGSLVVATGEGSDRREAAQDPRSHLGKLLRIAGDGTVPPGNPFVARADAAPEVYTLGHRNVQGLALVEGVLYASEHGPRGGDELNRIEPGANYGWPLATRGLDYAWVRVSPFTSLPGLVDPRYVWTPAISPNAASSRIARSRWSASAMLAMASPCERMRSSTADIR
uniref:PQQ-dependent sugar dehydrogenase n=1 Tax=Coralloluteibacterium stylophorae TaxID=1776034 RepID=A0A8J7VVJ9_9GAMM